MLEEVRASIAQRLADQKTRRLVRRMAQDPTSNVRGNKSKQVRRAGEVLYDTARIVDYRPNPSGVATLTLQPMDRSSNLSKTYYGHDLVLLAQDAQLTKERPSNNL